MEKIYKSNSGTVYVNVKNFFWEEVQAFKVIKETSHVIMAPGKTSRDFEDLDDGTLICQSTVDENVGYRIDLGYNNMFTDIQSSARTINYLQSLQPSIKLTEFPYGVITRENRVVGEVMPFYPNSVDILDYIGATSDKNILSVYKQVLMILKEMHENGILYCDIHGGNFVVNDKSGNPVVRAIDFEGIFLSFSRERQYGDYAINSHLNNLRRLLNNIKKVIKSQDVQDSLTSMTDDYEKSIKR